MDYYDFLQNQIITNTYLDVQTVLDSLLAARNSKDISVHNITFFFEEELIQFCILAPIVMESSRTILFCSNEDHAARFTKQLNTTDTAIGLFGDYKYVQRPKEAKNVDRFMVSCFSKSHPDKIKSNRKIDLMLIYSDCTEDELALAQGAYPQAYTIIIGKSQ